MMLFKMLSAARHPNVLRLLDNYGERGEIVLVFPWMDTTLWHHFNNRSGTFALREVRQLIGDMCSGIGHLHGFGIRHQDLSMKNCLIDCMGDGRLKVADLGMATSAEDMATARRPQKITTYPYRAPEVMGQHR
jgi:serine/threonine protein kinase